MYAHLLEGAKHHDQCEEPSVCAYMGCMEPTLFEGAKYHDQCEESSVCAYMGCMFCMDGMYGTNIINKSYRVSFIYVTSYMHVSHISSYVC